MSDFVNHKLISAQSEMVPPTFSEKMPLLPVTKIYLLGKDLPIEIPHLEMRYFGSQDLPHNISNYYDELLRERNTNIMFTSISEDDGCVVYRDKGNKIRIGIIPASAKQLGFVNLEEEYKYLHSFIVPFICTDLPSDATTHYLESLNNAIKLPDFTNMFTPEVNQFIRERYHRYLDGIESERQREYNREEERQGEIRRKIAGRAAAATPMQTVAPVQQATTSTIVAQSVSNQTPAQVVIPTQEITPTELPVQINMPQAQPEQQPNINDQLSIVISTAIAEINPSLNKDKAAEILTSLSNLLQDQDYVLMLEVLQRVINQMLAETVGDRSETKADSPSV